MRTLFLKIVRVRSALWFLGAAYLLLLPASVLADGESPAWEQFRRQFPYHMQIIGLAPEADGRWQVLITEPPHHVTLEELGAALRAEDLQIKAQAIGHDGWVHDVVATLPAIPETQLNDRLGDLQQLLHHGSYKAEVVRLPVSDTAKESRRPYDITVSSDELMRWLFADSARFLPVTGDRAVSMREILGKVAPGTFLSVEPGFVLWSIPRGEQIELASHATDAQRWVLDSDLVLGAIGSQDRLVIIGRERALSPLELPPLRIDQILMLASVEDEELAQSYERNYVLAGPLDEAEDWAPIYLSDSLIDTEYGSLLNITDQILKSWSLNGLVTYQNFPYPKPARWAWPRPLTEELNVSELTFNWNTTGAGYVVPVGDYEVCNGPRILDHGLS